MFLYDSHGKAVAYRRSPEDKWLWDTHGRWLGWFPWGDNDAYTKHGQYLGTIVGNRLFCRIGQSYRGYPGYPGYPGYAGYPGYGGYGGYSPTPPGFRDVENLEV
jgi:hypothetical protein